MRGRDAGQKNKNTKLADEFKELCPPHKLKDLDALIKKLKGNKEQIRESISLWWDEPAEVEEQWEDVSKKTSKKQHSRSNQSGRENGFGGDRNGRDNGGREGYHGRGGGRGGFRSGDRGGRGGHGRGMTGGRGGGADRERRRDNRNSERERSDRYPKSAPAAPSEPIEKKQRGIPGPAPVKTERPLQGVWVKAAAPAPIPTPAAIPASPIPTAPVTPVSPPEPAPVEVKPVEPEPVYDVGIVTAQDPTPSGFIENADVIQTTVAPPAPKPATSTGNVWATRGSAHIIQAEKPKPPQPVKKQQPIVEQPLPTEITEPIPESNSILPEVVLEDPIVTQPTTTSNPLESGLPASVNGANINAAGWKPMESNTTSSVDIVNPSPVGGPVSVGSAPATGDLPLLDNIETMTETILVTEEPAPSIPAAIESLKPASALNLGHWETGDGEDNVSHDFGFGFGQENDVASVDEPTNGSTTGANVASVAQPTPAANVAATENVNVAAVSTVSPARPPPGLVMPPPDQIVHVHELESKLESVTLAKNDDVNEKVDIAKSSSKEVSSATQSNNAYVTGAQPAANNEGFVQMPPAGVMSQQNYTGQYGMGMYSYNGQNQAVAAPNGFMGVPNQAAPLLSSGVLPQQKQQNVTAQQQGAGLPQQGSLYGVPSPANPATESSTTTDSSNPANPSTNNAGIPPGMPAGMPYNPALFYGQQPYQMGQPHQVGAYGFPAYGGQYAGVQGGFGYQQVMGQGAGYGQPQPYDDQGHGNHNNNNTHQGGYNKNSGGYRGRNNHNNHHHNQYQNQYNPQGHGGYGGQPYNMGYNDFNQRGGYGPGSHMDSNYIQNSGGYQSSGFNQDEGQQMSKGKTKGGNRNFGSNPNNMHQYQQSQQQQQFGGLNGAGNGGVSDTSGNNGLNYQNWGGAGL